MEQWYTLYTKPNAEYQVAAALQQRQLQVYLPEIEAARRGRPQHLPFFPCYLFVKIDFETVGYPFVRWTPGLRRIVSFGDRPAALPDSLIGLMQQQLYRPAGRGQRRYDFEPGDPVRIVDGPFGDMVAIFDGSVQASERVRVLLTVLGRVSRLEIEAARLEKAPAGAGPPPPHPPRRTRGRGRPIRSGGRQE